MIREEGGPGLTQEQADYIDRWIELYAIRPVGIPADGAPVESWEARIINTLRTWGTRRQSESFATAIVMADTDSSA